VDRFHLLPSHGSGDQCHATGAGCFRAFDIVAQGEGQFLVNGPAISKNTAQSGAGELSQDEVVDGRNGLFIFV
jgi:hypothetical protein